MKKNKKPIIIAIIVIALIYILLGSVIKSILNYNSDYNSKNEYNDKTFSIISSEENKELDDIIKKYAKKKHYKVEITYADTLDIMSELNSGSKYDAVWISNSIWLYMLDSSKVSVTNSKSTSINPVVFAVKKSKATQLGLDKENIYTKDIIEAISSGKLKFSMSNPTSTNTGASAYLGILNYLAGSPEVLTEDMINDANLKEKMKTFFTGLERTSGSEDFLSELYLKGDYEAVVTYESSIINLNKQLEKDKKETLYAIYPIDGVSISDSPFAYIDNKDEYKKEIFDSIQTYLLSDEGQKALESFGRRTWYGGVNKDAPSDIFNKEWGIDTTKYISPVKYPSTTVIKKSLAMYQVELRKPVHVVFALDYSGSMWGDGIKELRKAMNYILTDEASKDMIEFNEKDKIDVIVFNSTVGDVWSSTGDKTSEILEKINKEEPTGTTALHPAATKAVEILKDENDDFNTSVILMTDGAGNVGSYGDFEKAYKKINQDIPIYSITFGSASEYQLEKIAALTNGKVFDGKTSLVTAFKKVRGYN